MGMLGGRGGRWWRRRNWGLACVALAAAWYASSAGIAAAAGENLALLVLTNQARAAQKLPPLAWNDDLATAALAHSDDLASHGGNCDLHDSCDGEVWWRRVQRYYPNWYLLGENVGVSISDPVALHEGWMASAGHRANILNPSFSEFGAAVVLGQTNFGKLAFATEDFGSRGIVSPSAYPALPAGSIWPLDGATEPRELQVTYYHSGGAAPQAVRALVGSSCVDLTLQDGKASYGTYGATRAFTGSGCIPVVFEAIRSDGVRARFPKDAAMLVGVGADGARCAERTTAVPTQDCGGGTPAPTPTPGVPATPTPDETQLNALHVALKPGKSNTSRGIVQLHASLPAMTGFDPAATAVSIRVRFERSGDWSVTLPQLCGGKPCLTLNKPGTSYHAKYDSKTTLNLTRSGKSGRWTVHFMARGQSLGSLGAGLVDLTLSVGGATFTGSVDGVLKQSGLFAN